MSADVSSSLYDRPVLVIETGMHTARINALDVDAFGLTAVAGSDQNLHVVERFTAVDADTLSYEFTVDDPTVWSRPWTAVLHLHRIDQPIYEFACHEGNFLIMEDMLRVLQLPDQR